MKPSVWLACLLPLLGLVPAHAVLYSVTDLGTLGGTTSQAYSINSAGTIVGQANTGSDNHAFSYSGGVMIDLGTLGGTFSAALGINSSGTIVGNATTTGDVSQDAFIDSAGTMTDLNSLLDGSGAGWSLTSAQAINDLGQIVGYGTTGGQTHAFLLTPEPSACAMLIGGLGLLTCIIRRRKLHSERGA